MDGDLATDLQCVLNTCLPPTVLVDDQLNVLRFFADASLYLRPRNGSPSSRLVDLIPADLQPVVLTATDHARKSGQEVRFTRQSLLWEGGPRSIDLRVVPLPPQGESRRFAVSFEMRDIQTDESGKNSEVQPDAAGRLDELEAELDATRQQLHIALQNSHECRSSLQRANEQLMAANEEMQVSNEELRSVNEELNSVNAECRSKIDELTEMSADLENLFGSADVYVLFLDEELRIRRFTPKIAQVFHLVDEDVRRPIETFAQHLVYDQLVQRLRNVLATGTAFEDQVRDRGGSDFAMQVVPYRVEGQTRGVVLTLTDVTRLIHSQKQALEAAQRFERAVAASTDGIWDWPDVTQDAMWWSAECYRMLGYEPDAFPATFTAWFNRIHPVDRHLMQNTMFVEGKRCFVDLHRDIEYRIQHRSGEYRWYRHHTLVEWDDTGRPRRMTGSVSDIHLRKRAELRAQNEIQRRDSFLAMLSQELRDPMAAIVSAVELLDDVDELQDASGELDARELYAVISRQATHMTRVLDDLLETARIQQNKIQFKKRGVNLVTLAQETLLAVQPQVEARHQNVHSSVPMSAVAVFADPDRLVQAQVNLLTNASRESGEYQDIFYDVSVEAEHAVITVRDSGAGITDEKLETIFDLFAETESPQGSARRGMGVGLALARSIVEAHGGTLEAESEGPGKGSQFTIRLPLVPSSEALEQESGGVAAARPVAGERLLLVEDNVDVLRLLDQVLSRAGYEVACANDGYEALEVFERFDPRVVVVDIGLPGMNGYELARKIRKGERGSDVLLISVTGYGLARDQAEAEASGFDRHLVKPVNHDLLLGVIESLLANKHTTK